MRLRFLVPRRGRRSGLGGLAALALLAGCGGSDEPRTPALEPVPRFAIGINEMNPHLLAPGEQPVPFDRFRDALHALQPSFVRVLVDWSTIQKSPDRPPDFATPRDGCARGTGPCAPYAGIRDTLRGVRALGVRAAMLLYGTPDWAARGPEGCEEADVTPWGRMPRLEPYRALVRSVVAAAEAEGVELAFVSPWNEPNHPHFLNPQRAGCDRESRALAPTRYAELVRVAAEELGGLDRVLLGETAGLLTHTHAVGAGEFAEDMPDDLVCGAAGWAQHTYVSAADGAGGARVVDPVLSARVLREVKAGLAAHGACEDMAAALRRWRRDPQIRGAFQYSLREDPDFPVGLADAALTRLYPVHEAWRTRGRSC
jgi:hypothetical protein